MSVLNRAMFNQTVNRKEGSPPAGEENFFESLIHCLGQVLGAVGY